MNIEVLYTADKFGKPLHFNLYEEGFDDAKKICAVKAQAKLDKALELLTATVNPFDKRTAQQRHEQILQFLEENK
jgi:hypothetical protein